MKKLLLVTAFSVLGAMASQALEITVTGAANSTTKGSSSEGTFTATGLVSDNSAPPQTLGYTISGLTLDGFGVENDSVRIEFQVNSHGQNLQTSGTTAAGWLSAGGVALDANGEFVQLSNTLVRVDLNGVSGTGSGSFVGFTQVGFGSWGLGDVAVVNGISQAYVDGTADKTLTLPTDLNLLAQFDTAVNTGAALDAAGTWRPEAWDFVIDVVQVSIEETAFNGLIDSTWNTAGNWTNGVPTASKRAYVNGGLTANLSGGSGTALNLEVAGIAGQDGTVTNGTLTVGAGTAIATASNTTGIVELSSYTAGSLADKLEIATAENASGRLVAGSASLTAEEMTLATGVNSVGVLDLGTGSLSLNAESTVGGGVGSSGTVDVATLDMNSFKLSIGTSRDSYGRVTVDSFASNLGALTMGTASNAVGHFEVLSGLTTHNGNIYTAVNRDSRITLNYPGGLLMSSGANLNMGDGQDAQGTLTTSSLEFDSAGSVLIVSSGDGSSNTFALGGSQIAMSHTNAILVGRGIGSSHNLTPADFDITGTIGDFSVGDGTGVLTNLFNTHDSYGSLDVRVPFEVTGNNHYLTGLSLAADLTVTGGTTELEQGASVTVAHIADSSAAVDLADWIVGTVTAGPVNVARSTGATGSLVAGDLVLDNTMSVADNGNNSSGAVSLDSLAGTKILSICHAGTVSSTGTVTVAGDATVQDLRVGQGVDTVASLNVGGTLTITRYLNLDKFGSGSTSTVVADTLYKTNGYESVDIAGAADSTGSLTADSGVLKIGDMKVATGDGSVGVFSISNSTVSLNGVVDIATGANSDGNVLLALDSIATNNVNIGTGSNSVGRLTQTGGTLLVSALTLGSTNPTGVKGIGIIDLAGGDLVLAGGVSAATGSYIDVTSKSSTFDWVGRTQVDFEALWNSGVLRSNGESGLTGKSFDDYLYVSGDSLTATLVGFISIANGLGGVDISWDSKLGQSYNVGTNLNLAIPGGWGVYTNVTGIGGTMSVTVPASASAVFYQVTTP